MNTSIQTFLTNIFDLYHRQSYPDRNLLRHRKMSRLRHILTCDNYTSELDNVLSIGYNADIHLANGETPFSIAMTKSRLDYGCVLLHHGASPFKCPHTLSCLTKVYFGVEVYLDLLLERKYDLNTPFPDGKTTLLEAAVDERNVPLIKYLSSLNSSKNDFRWAILNRLVDEDMASIIEVLFEN